MMQSPMYYKERATNFWEWFASESERFGLTIENKHCSDLEGETIAAVDKLYSGMAWVYGPGESKGEHSLTLTAEGILHRQFLTDYWLKRAPALRGWRFYSSRQPSKTGGVLEINGERYGRNEMWVTPVPNADRENFNITVWHPKFANLDNQGRQTVMYLWLDEVLGEHGTMNWIGGIKINDARLRESMPLDEMLAFIQKTSAKLGWKKYPSGKSYSGYRIKEPGNDFLRADTIVGSSANYRLIGDYLDAKGELDDPLDGTGADFVFVFFSSDFLPKGEEAATRGKIEDQLEEALQSANSGQIIGGATGIKNAYIDAIIFDGENSLNLIKQTLNARTSLSGVKIHYFAASKRHLGIEV